MEGRTDGLAEVGLATEWLEALVAGDFGVGLR